MQSFGLSIFQVPDLQFLLSENSHPRKEKLLKQVMDQMCFLCQEIESRPLFEQLLL